MSGYGKYISIGAVLILIGIGAFLGPSFIRDLQIKRAIDALEAPYREDVYGGKSPEETFDMFLDTLKKGDLELASKYFIIRKQAEYKEKFEKMRSEETLEEQIREWERARNEWEGVVDNYNDWKTHATVRYFTILEQPLTKKLPDGTGGFIEHTFPAGEYGHDIIFDLNELTNIWKITLL